jgi:hypothetical protein
VLRESHVGIARHNPLSQRNRKKGEGYNPFPFFWLAKNLGKADFNFTWFLSRLSLLACPASEPHPLQAHSVLPEEPVPQVLQVQAAGVAAALVLPSYHTQQMLA